jgi:hypothetical protein
MRRLIKIYKKAYPYYKEYVLNSAKAQLQAGKITKEKIPICAKSSRRLYNEEYKAG